MKTWLITGCSSGIGRGIAKAALQKGYQVVATARRLETVQDLTAAYPQRALAAALDVTKPDSIRKALQAAEERFGLVDVLVNNAGVLGGDISNADERQYDLIMDTNLKGTFFLSQAIGRYMKRQNIAGNILNIASSSSFRPASSAYTMSKWGLRGLTLGLAKSFSPYGIVVNGVAPGPTATPMLLKDRKDDLTFEHNPLGRFALPEEIANMAVFLVSDMGRTIVGDIVCMTGGAGLVTFDDVDYKF